MAIILKGLRQTSRSFLRGEKMTDKEAKSFYNSSAWKTKRILILNRDHWECQDCVSRIKSGKELRGNDRRINRAVDVHHIKELKEHPELALEDDNLISLCVPCHNIRHGREPKKFKRKKKLVSIERW